MKARPQSCATCHGYQVRMIRWAGQCQKEFCQWGSGLEKAGGWFGEGLLGQSRAPQMEWPACRMLERGKRKRLDSSIRPGPSSKGGLCAMWRDLKETRVRRVGRFSWAAFSLAAFNANMQEVLHIQIHGIMSCCRKEFPALSKQPC